MTAMPRDSCEPQTGASKGVQQSGSIGADSGPQGSISKGKLSSVLVSSSSASLESQGNEQSEGRAQSPGRARSEGEATGLQQIRASVRSRKSARLSASAGVGTATASTSGPPKSAVEKNDPCLEAAADEQQNTQTTRGLHRPLMMRAEAFCADKPAENSHFSAAEQPTSTPSRKRKRGTASDIAAHEDLDNNLDGAKRPSGAGGSPSMLHPHMDAMRAAQRKARMQYMHERRNESIKLKSAVQQRYEAAEAAEEPYASDVEQDPEEYIANLRQPRSNTNNGTSTPFDERLHGEFWGARVRKQGIGGAQALVTVYARFPEVMLATCKRTRLLSSLFSNQSGPKRNKKNESRKRDSGPSGSRRKVQKLRKTRSFQNQSERASGSLQKGSEYCLEGSEAEEVSVEDLRSSGDQNQEERDQNLELEDANDNDDDDDDVVVLDSSPKRRTRASASMHVPSPRNNNTQAHIPSTHRVRAGTSRGKSSDARDPRTLRASTRKSREQEAEIEALVQALSTPSAAAKAEGGNSRGRMSLSTRSAGEKGDIKGGSRGRGAVSDARRQATAASTPQAAARGERGDSRLRSESAANRQATKNNISNTAGLRAERCSNDKTPPATGRASDRCGMPTSSARTLPLSAVVSGGVAKSQSKGKGKGGAAHSQGQRRQGRERGGMRSTRSNSGAQKSKGDSGCMPLQACALLEVAAQRTKHAQHGDASNEGANDATYQVQPGAGSDAAQQPSEKGDELERSLEEQLQEELYADLETQAHQGGQEQAGPSHGGAQTGAGPSHTPQTHNTAPARLLRSPLLQQQQQLKQHQSQQQARAAKEAELDDKTAQIAAQLADPNFRAVHASTSQVQAHTHKNRTAQRNASAAAPSATPPANTTTSQAQVATATVPATLTVQRNGVVKLDLGVSESARSRLTRVEAGTINAAHPQNAPNAQEGGYYHLPERKMHARFVSAPSDITKYPAAGPPPPYMSPMQSRTLRSVQMPAGSSQLRYPWQLFGRTARLSTLVVDHSGGASKDPKTAKKNDKSKGNLTAQQKKQQQKENNKGRGKASPAAAAAERNADPSERFVPAPFPSLYNSKSGGAEPEPGTAGVACVAGTSGLGRAACAAGIAGGAIVGTNAPGSIAAGIAGGRGSGGAAGTSAQYSQAEKLRSFLTQLGPLDDGCFDVIRDLLKQSPGSASPAPKKSQHAHIAITSAGPSKAKEAVPAHAAADMRNGQPFSRSVSAPSPVHSIGNRVEGANGSAGAHYAAHAATAAQHAAQCLNSQSAHSGKAVSGRKLQKTPEATKDTNHMHAPHASRAPNEADAGAEDLQECLSLEDYDDMDVGIEDVDTNCRKGREEIQDELPPGVQQTNSSPKRPTVTLPNLRAYVSKSVQSQQAATQQATTQQAATQQAATQQATTQQAATQQATIHSATE